MDFDLQKELIVHVASYHTERRDLNEHNLGLGLRLKDGRRMLAAGFYDNSFDRDSFYAGIGYDAYQYKFFTARITAGFVTGYRDKTIPFALPEAVVHVGPVDLMVGYIPELAEYTYETFTLSIGARF